MCLVPTLPLAHLLLACLLLAAPPLVALRPAGVPMAGLLLACLPLVA